MKSDLTQQTSASQERRFADTWRSRNLPGQGSIYPADADAGCLPAHVARVICFDLDGTLYNQSALRARIAWTLAKAWLLREISTLELRLLRQYRRNRELARGWGEVPELENRVRTVTAQQASVNVSKVANVVERWINRAPLPILRSMRDRRLRETLQLLRVRGYKLGLLSDYPACDKLKALGLPNRLFDAIVESCGSEVNALKPHTKGFLLLCEKLKIQPHEALYVGDRESIDGAGARAARMQFLLCGWRGLDRRAITKLEKLLKGQNRFLPSPGALSLVRNSGCWLCGSDSNIEYAPSHLPRILSPELVKITDSHYGATGRLLRCNDCGFVYADLASIQAIEPLYAAMVDDDYLESSGPRARVFAQILATIRELRPTAATLLDIGAGVGAFCIEAKRQGFEAEGVEPSAWAAEKAKASGVKIYPGYFPHMALDGEQFDVVTALDVVEHVSQPLNFLRACQKVLKPGGLLVVVTPDIGSLAARVMGRRWWHFRIAHIGYFSRKTMFAAFEGSGFIVDRVENYTWRFPISYLIERLGKYLPVGKLSAVLNIQCFRWAGRMQLPVRLYDSYVYYAAVPEASDGK